MGALRSGRRPHGAPRSGGRTAGGRRGARGPLGCLGKAGEGSAAHALLQAACRELQQEATVRAAPRRRPRPRRRSERRWQTVRRDRARAHERPRRGGGRAGRRLARLGALAAGRGAATLSVGTRPSRTKWIPSPIPTTSTAAAAAIQTGDRCLGASPAARRSSRRTSESAAREVSSPVRLAGSQARRASRRRSSSRSLMVGLRFSHRIRERSNLAQTVGHRLDPHVS